MEISDSNVDPVLRHDAGQVRSKIFSWQRRTNWPEQTAPSGNGESSTQGQQHLESPKRQTRSQTGKRRNPADDVQPNKRLRPKDPPVPPPEDVPPSLSTTFPSRGPRPRAANLPVPVPNLTKKSRGRRVPTAELDTDGDNDKRTYACPVHGCGKCFHRGEHLKRHIRSIHTHDKRMSPPPSIASI